MFFDFGFCFVIVIFASVTEKTRNMTDQKFHMTRYLRDESTGGWSADGAVRSLEDDFGFIRYKSLTGINAFGKQKGVYTESYAESDSLRVFISPTPTQEAITSTLTVLSFGSRPGFPSSSSVSDQVRVAEENWHALVEFLRGGLILWQDDYRQRKALFLLCDAITPATDNIKGVPYLECQISLQNVFGETYPSSSSMIEGWLKNGGEEVSNG